MTQEDKELLLKDLYSRLPYGVKVFSKTLNKPTFIKGITNDYVWVYIDENNYEWEPVEDVKLYLRPMSSMTEKEKKEFDELMYGVEERCINACGKGGYTLAFTTLNDWLNAHHLDYRGLIKKGLALEAPEGMYK